MPGIRPDDGTELALVNQVVRDRNRRPSWGGTRVVRTQPGWHMLDHCGRIEGYVVAEYHLAAQIKTQAGTRPAVVNLYSVHYMSQQ